MRSKRLAVAAALATVALAGPVSAQSRKSLVLVSIDGLNPNYVTEADRYGLKIPTLRRILRDGAHAASVKGVLPTVTYPNHTTIVTGVWPVKHGIFGNVAFDPLRLNMEGWNWYSEDIRVPTLWAAASSAGYVVGSVAWPVSVGAAGVRYLIPEYWRAQKTDDDLKLLRALSSPGLLSDLEKRHGPYIVDLDNSVPGDWVRTRYANSIVKDKGARLLTLHLAALDHIEHDTGPASKEGFAALEEIDKMVGMLWDTIRSLDQDAAICVVSDHGLTRVDRELNLNVAFIKAGLMTPVAVRASPRVPAMQSWAAQPWLFSGSAAILLKNPADEANRRKAMSLLHDLAEDPANGIEAVLDATEIAQLGGAPAAMAWVSMKPGFTLGSALTGPLVKSIKTRGVHGYSPIHPEMQASFFIAGSGIATGKALGPIDMRAIAPTLAKHLRTRLPDTDFGPLPVFNSGTK